MLCSLLFVCSGNLFRKVPKLTQDPNKRIRGYEFHPILKQSTDDAINLCQA